jgi:hypothetical protein
MKGIFKNQKPQSGKKYRIKIRIKIEKASWESSACIKHGTTLKKMLNCTITGFLQAKSPYLRKRTKKKKNIKVHLK